MLFTGNENSLVKDFNAEPASFHDHDPRISYFMKGAPTQKFGDYFGTFREGIHAPSAGGSRCLSTGGQCHRNDLHFQRPTPHYCGLQSGHIAYWCCGKRTDVPLEPKVQAMCLFFGARGPLTRDLPQTNGDLRFSLSLAPLGSLPKATGVLSGLKQRAICCIIGFISHPQRGLKE